MFETGRYTLGVGGADDVVWSSVLEVAEEIWRCPTVAVSMK